MIYFEAIVKTNIFLTDQLLKITCLMTQALNLQHWPQEHVRINATNQKKTNVIITNVPDPPPLPPSASNSKAPDVSKSTWMLRETIKRLQSQNNKLLSQNRKLSKMNNQFKDSNQALIRELEKKENISREDLGRKKFLEKILKKSLFSLQENYRKR